MMKKVRFFFWRLVHAYYKYLPYYSIRRLYLPLKNIKIRKPIFLLGVQGGGLTIVSRSIKRHSNVVSMRGNNTYWTGQDELMAQKNIPKEFSVLYPENGKSICYDEVFGSERLWWTYATDRLYKKYYCNETSYTHKLDTAFKNIIKVFIRGYAKNPQHARYCEKSQLFSLKIKLLKRIFPDAKFILVLRNPYAICFRIAKKNYEAMSSGKITQYSYEEKLTLAAQHWKNSIQTALQDLKDINEGYIIKIEDYLKKPEKYIEEIVTYCELPYEGDLLPAKHQKLPRGSLDTKKWYPLEKEINAKYLKGLSKKHKDIITKEIGKPLLKKAGYI